MKALLLDLEVYKFKNDKNELAIQLNEWINSYFIEFKASCDDKLKCKQCIFGIKTFHTLMNGE